MSALALSQQRDVCYRCRNPATPRKELISCSLCSLFWHVDCLSKSGSSSSSSSSSISSPSSVDPPLGSAEWTCPQHQKPQIAKKRKTGSKKSIRRIARSEMIEEFEEADEMIRYGGILNKVSEKTLEKHFLDYAKRYRCYNGSEIYQAAEFKTQEEWLEGLESFENQGTNNDGIQMLIDAAHMDLDMFSLPSRKDRVIDLDIQTISNNSKTDKSQKVKTSY